MTPKNESIIILGIKTHPFWKVSEAISPDAKIKGNWLNDHHSTISFPAHGLNVVTCLQCDDDKIVSAYGHFFHINL